MNVPQMMEFCRFQKKRRVMYTGGESFRVAGNGATIAKSNVRSGMGRGQRPTACPAPNMLPAPRVSAGVTADSKDGDEHKDFNVVV
jgi:hypothetical protein